MYLCVILLKYRVAECVVRLLVDIVTAVPKDSDINLSIDRLLEDRDKRPLFTPPNTPPDHQLYPRTLGDSIDTVSVVLLRRRAKDKNPPRIFTLLDSALITEDNPFPVCFISVLMLLSPGKTMCNMVFSLKTSLPTIIQVLYAEICVRKQSESHHQRKKATRSGTGRRLEGDGLSILHNITPQHSSLLHQPPAFQTHH